MANTPSGPKGPQDPRDDELTEGQAPVTQEGASEGNIPQVIGEQPVDLRAYFQLNSKAVLPDGFDTAFASYLAGPAEQAAGGVDLKALWNELGLEGNTYNAVGDGPNIIDIHDPGADISEWSDEQLAARWGVDMKMARELRGHLEFLSRKEVIKALPLGARIALIRVRERLGLSSDPEVYGSLDALHEEQVPPRDLKVKLSDLFWGEASNLPDTLDVFHLIRPEIHGQAAETRSLLAELGLSERFPKEFFQPPYNYLSRQILDASFRQLEIGNDGLNNIKFTGSADLASDAFLDEVMEEYPAVRSLVEEWGMGRNTCLAVLHQNYPAVDWGEKAKLLMAKVLAQFEAISDEGRAIYLDLAAQCGWPIPPKYQTQTVEEGGEE